MDTFKQPRDSRARDAGKLTFWQRVIQFIWIDFQWFFIAGFWILTLIFGCIGFSKYLIAIGEDDYFLQRLYLTLQLFVLHTIHLDGPVSWQLELARYLAPAVATYTAVRAFILLFYGQWLRARLGLYRNHIIICGLGRIGTLLTKHLREDRRKIVVIEKDEGNDNIQKAKDRGAIVLIGDAVDPRMLRKAKINTADRCVVCTRDDGVNIEIARQARELSERKDEGPLKCSVHIITPHLYDLFKNHTLMTNHKKESFAVSTFNIHSCGAAEMLKLHPPFKKIDECPPRVIVIGLGQFGQSTIVEIAIAWAIEVPRERIEDGLKIKVLAIDERATLKKPDMFLRYPSIPQFCDVEFKDMDIESEDFRKDDFLKSIQEPDVSMVYVCIDDDRLGLQAAMWLLPHLKNKHQVPVVVRTVEDKGYGSLINEAARDVEYMNLHAFELMARTCQPKLLGFLDEELAKAFHERYCKQQADLGETPATNPSMRPWEEIPESLRLSNRRQADSAYETLDKAGFSIVFKNAPGKPLTKNDKEYALEIENIGKIEHDRFVAERMRDGWEYGKPKNIENKISPTFVPWDDLTPQVQSFDSEWAKELPDLLEGVGKKICKKHGNQK